MYKWMIARKLHAFERNNNYDGSYLHELLALDLGAFLKFEAATKLGTFRVEELARVLADDAVHYSDGGGKSRAALNPIIGKAQILRFFSGIRAKGSLSFSQTVPAVLNGLPGFVLQSPEGTETLAFDVEDGHIIAIYAVRNPDKVRHLS